MIGHVLDGGRIRQLRRARCLTQAELAAKLGVTQTNVSNIERGRIGRPQCLAELAAFLGVRVWDLLVLPGSADETLAGAGGGTRPARAGTPPSHDPPFWTVPEAATVLGVSRKIVYRLVQAGALDMQKAGRSWRIPSASVRACLRPPARPVCDPVPAWWQRPELEHIDGRRLRALRQARGWTQLELACRAGLSLSSVSALETGHYTKTSALAGLAQALGAEAAELQEPAAPPPDPAPGGEDPGVPVPPA